MTRTVASWILAGFLGAVASAQQPKPRFEVASVKPSGLVTPSRGTWTDVMNSVGLRRLPDGITARQETVHSLVISAYGVLPYQIVGGPDWMKSDQRTAPKIPGKVCIAIQWGDERLLGRRRWRPRKQSHVAFGNAGH
jgi:hypothetical protein